MRIGEVYVNSLALARDASVKIMMEEPTKLKWSGRCKFRCRCSRDRLPDVGQAKGFQVYQYGPVYCIVRFVADQWILLWRSQNALRRAHRESQISKMAPPLFELAGDETTTPLFELHTSPSNSLLPSNSLNRFYMTPLAPPAPGQEGNASANAKVSHYRPKRPPVFHIATCDLLHTISLHLAQRLRHPRAIFKRSVILLSP
jgi:hypothetical protein